MPNDFHKMLRLKSHNECDCRLFQTGFPEHEAEADDEGRTYNPNHWEKVTDGPITQAGDELEMRDGATLRYKKPCQTKYARGLAFNINAEVDPSADGRLYYACNADLDSATGYVVKFKTAALADLPGGNTCNVEVLYQGSMIIHRWLPTSSLQVAFEHLPDEDGGGVQITFSGGGGGGSSSTFTHTDGPQISDDQYWGIGAGGPVTFTGLTVDHMGTSEEGRFCQDCPPVAKATACDFEASCGGGTLIEDGETVDYDWGGELCISYITPHNQGGWYLVCYDETTPLDYSWWTFSELSATMDFSGAEHCGDATPPSADMGFVAWRFFRITSCEASLTLTINMEKSKCSALLANIVISPACGVPNAVFDDVEPKGLNGFWSASSCAIVSFMTCSSTSSSTYFNETACIADDDDTITVDIEGIPPGIYRMEVDVSPVSFQFGPYAPEACSTESVYAWTPSRAEFLLEGDALPYDPICR